MLFLQNLTLPAKRRRHSSRRTPADAEAARAPAGTTPVAMMNMVRSANPSLIDHGAGDGDPAPHGRCDWTLRALTLERVGLVDLSEVSAHHLSTHNGMRIHRVQFNEGGSVQYAHDLTGRLVALITSQATAHFDSTGSVLFGAQALAPDTARHKDGALIPVRVSAPDGSPRIAEPMELQDTTLDDVIAATQNVSPTPTVVRNYRFRYSSMRMIDRVGIDSLSQVCEHHIKSHAQSRTHLLRFEGGGNVLYAYSSSGVVLGLTTHEADVHFRPHGHCLVSAGARDGGRGNGQAHSPESAQKG